MGIRLVILFSIFAFLGACATSPTGRTQLVLMPDSQMDQMGLQAFTNIKQKTPVETDRAKNSFVQCVATAITRETGGRWEIVVFRDDSANAFALPGGKIGVNTGMLEVAANQHQLATVIGHEIAHVQARHSNERVSQKFAVEQGLGLINAVASPQTETGRTLMGLLGVGAQYGVLLPYTRLQESEADVIGLRIMAQAGFDPRESIRLWMNMNRASKGQPPEFLSTHPSHGSRISELEKHMASAQQLQARARQAGKQPDCK